ncbi:NADPH-dependent 3-demethoxyubiquinone 3-hydroxylase, mitochondrial [Rhinoderma darwinii]|uniref:NADPH-dependent 3-demethoxyubiquinone 3-hydroxylase, mitochondrial n=1 Tax=Rhinoderma darwinii TaxID=43563 RepID=UPI003F676F20
MERAAGLWRLRQLHSGLTRNPGIKGQFGATVHAGSTRHYTPGVHTDEERALLDRIIRVDHAGEYGANRIYAGQMAVLGRSSVGPIIQHMWDQEKDHLKKFNELMVSNRVRPTVLLPFWNVAGFALGFGTSLLGRKGAMACTVAVEETISNHYNNQIRTLMERDPEKHKELLQTIKKFRDEEMEHHDTGLEHDAELAPAYVLLKNVIQVGCRAAVYLSERI